MARRGSAWLQDQVVGLFDFFFPQVCPFCLYQPSISAKDPLCFGCQSDITPLPQGRCSLCALPFRAQTSSTHLCEDCSRSRPPYRQAHAAGLYQGSLKKALQDFKYAARIDLDQTLARLLTANVPAAMSEVDLIVPVPLHPQRLRHRGYNQALLLARLLARNLQISLEKAMLVRKTAGQNQQGLGARQRKENLKGAFACEQKLAGKRLLLVDDVMTTGATLAACSEALLAAGALSVDALVVARAPRD